MPVIVDGRILGTDGLIISCSLNRWLCVFSLQDFNMILATVCWALCGNIFMIIFVIDTEWMNLLRVGRYTMLAVRLSVLNKIMAGIFFYLRLAFPCKAKRCLLVVLVPVTDYKLSFASSILIFCYLRNCGQWLWAAAAVAHWWPRPNDNCKCMGDLMPVWMRDCL